MRLLLGLCVVVNVASVANAQTNSSEPCYPGLECASRGSGAQADALESGPVAAFRFNAHVVLDGAQNLIWARNLYVLGDTTVAYKNAYGGNESFSTALSKVKAQAASASAAGLTGWRLATQKELDTLMDRLAPTTIYAYFRPRTPDPPMRSVMGAFDLLEGGQRVVVDGVLYSNTSDGRATGNLGGAELNRYGFWLVKSLTPDVERTLAPTTEALREYYEPVEERRLKPVDTFQVRRRDGVFEFDTASAKTASVSTTVAFNTRFYARYDLKPLPRGALVSAEVYMRGLSANGAPLPTVLVQMKPGASQKSADPKELWAFAGGTDAAAWQMLGNARLELPAHISRNAYNTQEDFYLGFSGNVNSCTFQIPEVIIRFVREQNLLIRRQLP